MTFWAAFSISRTAWLSIRAIPNSQYSGSLCRLQPDQVGILWYNYATGTPTGGMNRMMAIQPRAARESRLCSRAWQAL